MLGKKNLKFSAFPSFTLSNHRFVKSTFQIFRPGKTLCKCDLFPGFINCHFVRRFRSKERSRSILKL